MVESGSPPHKMNLLMLSGDSSVAQGQESTFYRMLHRFSSHWERIDVICPRAEGAEARTVHGNVYLHPSPWHKIRQPWFIKKKGGGLLAERPYALITSHDFGFFYNGIGARWLARQSGVPVVSEIHHVEGYPHAVTSKERLYRALARRYIRRARRWAAAFRAVNQHEVPDLLRKLGVDEEKILVLPSLFIDYDIFRPLPDVEKVYDVVFVGRLAANKGLFTLIDAFAQARTMYPEIKLGILGSGPLRKEIDRRVRRHLLADNVTIIDRVDSAEEVARFYNRSKMLVCASTAEGGPRVTVEAMACGIPVISTPVGVMGELIVDGENGLLFDWQTARLAAWIRLLLHDQSRREQIGEAGRESVQDFGIEPVIDAYARGYLDLIDRLGGAD
jgi:glycosyltransferase involved in cell wall biosynthesis